VCHAAARNRRAGAATAWLGLPAELRADRRRPGRRTPRPSGRCCRTGR